MSNSPRVSLSAERCIILVFVVSALAGIVLVGGLWGITSLAGLLLVLIGGLGVAFAHGIGRRWKLAEQALRVSEQRFRTAAENLTDVVFDWDIKETVDWYGDIDGIMGYPAGGFPRTIAAWVATLHPEDKDRVTAALERHIRDAAPYVVEYRVQRRGGDWRWWSARGTALRDEQGNSYKMVGSITDITERKQAEDALRDVAAHQDAILATVPDIIIETDKHKVYTWSNRTGLEFFGNDVIGKEAAFFFEGEQESYKAVRPLFEGHEDVIYVESWQRRKDGERRLLAWWCHVLKDKQGGVSGAISTARDITEQRHAEESLRVSEQEFRSLAEALRESERFAHATVDALSDHIAVLDEAGVIIAVNRAWRVFAEANPPQASNVNEGANYLAVCDAAAGSDSELAAAAAAGIRAVIRDAERSFEMEYPCHSPETKRWFVCRVSRFPGSGAARVTIAHENITARKRAEDAQREQLEELQRWHEVSLGREGRVIELKREVNACLTRAGEKARYPSVIGEQGQ